MTALDWYNDALAGKNPPIHDGEPQCGYFRRKFKKKDGTYTPYHPAAIWRDEEGNLVCVVNGKQCDPNDEWTWLAGNPVPYEHYRAAVETGNWPNADEHVPQIGDNAPPEDDSVEGLQEQIDSALAGVDAYETIGDDETAAKAQSLRSRLNELSRQADKQREQEKAPHLAAGKAVDAKFKPLVTSAKGGADKIKAALEAHENRKFREEQERRRKEEEAARKAEEEARKAEEAGKPAPKAPCPKTEPIAEPPATQIKGGYGRSATIKTIKVAIVEDQDAAYQALKDHRDLKEFIQKLAQRAVDAGHEIAGVTVEEQRKVA